MKLLKFPLLYLIIEILILIIYSLLYSLTNDINSLDIFLTNNKIYIVLLLGVIFIPILYLNYQKYIKEKPQKINYILLILLGFILSIIFNTIFYYIDKSLKISNLYNSSSINIENIISTVLIGPIIEEIMFRGIMYNEALKKYSNMKAIIIVTVIFSLFHFNIFQSLYALALGFILIYVYLKNKTIIAPIIVHASSNLTTNLYVIIKNNFIINYGLFIFSLIILILIRRKYANNQNKKDRQKI